MIERSELLHIRLTKQEKRNLEKMSEITGKTKTSIIISALEQYYDNVIMSPYFGESMHPDSLRCEEDLFGKYDFIIRTGGQQ